MKAGWSVLLKRMINDITEKLRQVPETKFPRMRPSNQLPKVMEQFQAIKLQALTQNEKQSPSD